MAQQFETPNYFTELHVSVKLLVLPDNRQRLSLAVVQFKLEAFFKFQNQIGILDDLDWLLGANLVNYRAKVSAYA